MISARKPNFTKLSFKISSNQTIYEFAIAEPLMPKIKLLASSIFEKYS